MEGDWVKTFDDEFDGNDSIHPCGTSYGENYCDKQSHWSKDDVIVGGGVVTLRYEKKTGRHNDDPQAEARDGLRRRLPRYLRQMDPALRLLRSADEAADRARACGPPSG